MRHLLFLFLLLVGNIFAAEKTPSEDPLADVIPDSVIVQLVKGAGEAEDYPGSNVVYIFQHTNAEFYHSGAHRTREHLLIKMLTEQGAKQHAVLSFGYDPLSTSVKVLQIRVIKKDGRIVDIPLENIQDIPSPAGIIFWGGRQKVIGLPGLEVGDAVEYTIEKRGFRVAYLKSESEEEEKFEPPLWGHFYDIVYFQGREPILEKRYILIGPKDKPLQQEFFGGKIKYSCYPQGDKIIYTWEDKNIKPFKSEPGMVAFYDVAPKLVISTLATWEEKSRWFYEISEPSFEVDEAIKKKVAELTKDCTTPEEKMKALFYFVASQIRYLGLSMGKGEGYTPHPAIDTFHERAGVCKDKAGLLVAMLRVAGIPAYIVTTQVGSRVERVTADRFNHGIVAVPKEEGGYLILDPTIGANGRPFLPSVEAEQGMVIGTPEGETLTLTRYVAPEENPLEIHLTGRVDASGTLTGQMEVQADGYFDWQLRRILNRSPIAQRKVFFHKMWKKVFPQAKLLDVSFSDPMDFYKPMTIKIKFKVEDFAFGEEGCLVLKSPLGIQLFSSTAFGDFINALHLPERKYPLRLSSTREVICEETITFPEGLQVKFTPEEIDAEGPVISVTSTYEAETDEIQFLMELDIKKKQVSPEEYPDFKQTVEKLKKLQEQWIVLRR